MLKEAITTSPTSGVQKNHSPPLNYFLTDNQSSSNPLHSTLQLNRSVAMPLQLRQEMHIQELVHRSGGPPKSPRLNCTATLSPFNTFSTADAALLLESARGTV
jgi:hypothetical protein